MAFPYVKPQNTFTCAKNEYFINTRTVAWISQMSHARHLYESLEYSTYYIMFLLTLATLIYGVTSWWFIKKFRSYRNYVCLNAILANFFISSMLKITFYVSEHSSLNLNQGCWFSIITIYLLIYLATVKHHWLIVICHMFYVDIVKVFNEHTRKKYLKSGLFGWCVSLITTLVHFFVTSGFFINFDVNPSDVGFIIFILTLTVNCLLYFIIVYSLFRSSNTSGHTATNKWRRLAIATLIFILGDILLVSFHIISFINHVNTKPHVVRSKNLYLMRQVDFNHSQPRNVNSEIKMLYFLQILLYNLCPFLLNVYVVVVKSNRELWYEFYVNRFKRQSLKQKDHHIVMH